MEQIEAQTIVHAKKHNNMIRYGMVSIKQAFDAIITALTNREKLAKVQDFEFNADSQRYELFMKKGTTCCFCGLKGQYFCVEHHRLGGPRPHLNLYGIDDVGDEVLFTKDHITPRVAGGTNTIENYQTMCMPCNSEKGCSSTN